MQASPFRRHIGIHHAFSSPARYFAGRGLAQDGASVLDDFQRHWPTHEPHDPVDFARLGAADRGGRLALGFAPERSEAERETAAHEGWILGVLNSTAAALTAPAPPARATPRPRC